MSKKVEHVSWTLKPGDLVVVTKTCQAIPDTWPAGITMHEGNTPRLEPGTTGMVITMVGGDHDEYPFLRILVGDKIFGIFGKYIDLATTISTPTYRFTPTQQ